MQSVPLAIILSIDFRNDGLDHGRTDFGLYPLTKPSDRNTRAIPYLRAIRGHSC